MTKEIPYYTFDDEENTEAISSSSEAYIDDGDLKDLLIELLGDNVSDEAIQEILEAASDENITEEEFDKLIDQFISKNKN